MKVEELAYHLRSEKYGFPYFRMLLEKKLFFNSPIRLDLEKRNSNTIVFNNSIAVIFEIKDEHFVDCYDAVINGEGDEKRKIHSLRSSSLLGLLTFYKVHSGYSIRLRKSINGEMIDFIFDRVVFEKTNRVFHPSLGLSSVDVALYGTANGEQCVLYLESKFTEYLEGKDMTRKEKNHQVSYPISNKYAGYYHQLFRAFPGLDCSIEKGGISLFSNDGKAHYCDGIKQMISHYIGSKNSDDLFKGLKVYLGTILYDFSSYDCSVDSGGRVIQDYKSIYLELAKRLNAFGVNGLTVIENAFTYQDIFNQIQGYSLDKSVKEYYQL